MSKKQMNKKKINVKLNLGETTVVLHYDSFMHIAETYDFFASEQTDNEFAQWYRDIADIIRFQAAENCFYSQEEYDEW